MSVTTSADHDLTSLYDLRAKVTLDGTPLPLLVFIPGNPGLIDYYTTYLDLVQRQFPQFDILAISHAGFQTSGDYVGDGKKDRHHFPLQYQIEHKVHIIKKRILAGQTHVSFLCHSVGGYVTQRVVKCLLEDPELEGKVHVEFIGLICPTIRDIAQSLLGVLFGRLMTIPFLVSMAVWLCALLQRILSDAAARNIICKYLLAKPVDQSEPLLAAYERAVDATMKIYKSPRIVRQTLTMAQEELREILEHHDVDSWFFEHLPAAALPNKTPTQLWCFFAASDYWVHHTTREAILGQFAENAASHVVFEVGQPDTQLNKAITHSFCIDQTVEFAEVTCAALSRVFHASPAAKMALACEDMSSDDLSAGVSEKALLRHRMPASSAVGH